MTLCRGSPKSDDLTIQPDATFTETMLAKKFMYTAKVLLRLNEQIRVKTEKSVGVF